MSASATIIIDPVVPQNTGLGLLAYSGATGDADSGTAISAAGCSTGVLFWTSVGVLSLISATVLSFVNAGVRCDSSASSTSPTTSAADHDGLSDDAGTTTDSLAVIIACSGATSSNADPSTNTLSTALIGEQSSIPVPSVSCVAAGMG